MCIRDRDIAAVEGGIETIRKTDSPDILRSALLMACTWTLPACTMKEFESELLHEFIPGVLSFLKNKGAKNNNRESISFVEGETTISQQCLVVDFMTRVLLTCMVEGGRSAKDRDREEVSAMLSRQLIAAMNVTTAVSGGGLSSQVELFHLSLLAHVMTRIKALETRGKFTKEILVSFILEKMKRMHKREERIAAYHLFFSNFPQFCGVFGVDE